MVRWGGLGDPPDKESRITHDCKSLQVKQKQATPLHRHPKREPFSRFYASRFRAVAVLWAPTYHETLICHRVEEKFPFLGEEASPLVIPARPYPPGLLLPPPIGFAPLRETGHEKPTFDSAPARSVHREVVTFGTGGAHTDRPIDTHNAREAKERTSE